jgi:hypothetical protein
MTPTQVRAAAVQRLVAQLEGLVERYRAAEREGRVSSDDPELVTGEVARYLAGARAATAGVPPRR